MEKLLSSRFKDGQITYLLSVSNEHDWKYTADLHTSVILCLYLQCTLSSRI